MNLGLRKELGILAGLAAIGLLLSRQKSWGAALGLCAVGLRFLPTPSFSFYNRSIIITGGSRGLGLALAENLLREGAFVTLLARDMDELERAQEKLQATSSDKVLIIPCDVTEEAELKQGIEQAEAKFGRIDALVNNAGTISVGPFHTMEKTDFDAQFNLHLYTVINAVRLVIPAFNRVGGGRIVNISSIGGDLAVPHMSTYCASKFALAGLSETIAAELAPLNIKVTTVYPGLMRTGSPIQAVFKGDYEKEYAWFSTSDVMPGFSVSADYAAKKIIEGMRQGNAHVSFPLFTKVGIIGHAIFPETYGLFMRSAARFMPKSDSRARKTGAESQGWLERQLWYKPLKGIEEKAEKQFNQVEKFDANFNLGI